MAVVLWCAGCQLVGPLSEPANVESRPITAFEKVLGEEHWLPRNDWSPEREAKQQPEGIPSRDLLRWRYASEAFEDVFAEAKGDGFDEEQFLFELAQTDNLAGWNAAILLARRNPEKARPLRPLLARLVTEPPSYQPEVSRTGHQTMTRQIAPATRAAAAEAWCLVLASGRSDPIEALAPAGSALLENDLPDEVQGELFRGIGRFVPPANVPGLDEALPAVRNGRPNPASLRRAAIDACLLYALRNEAASETETPNPENPWPKTMQDWQWEPDAYFENDPQMRRRFSFWLVVTQHPNAAKFLESQLTDRDPLVRDEALVHLGRLKTPESLATLRSHAKRPEPRVRAMAAKGLSNWGVKQLTAFLNDESFEVRLSAAEELGRFPTPESAVWLKELQADPNPQVEAAALKAQRDWPDSLAVPILLHGMEHASLATRRDCFRELRRRMQLEDSFPIAAGPEARRTAIGRLVRDWNLPRGLEIPRTSESVNPKINRLRVEELQAYLSDVTNPDFPEKSARFQSAVDALLESSPDDVPAIEAYLLDSTNRPRADVIINRVLPKLSRVHAAISGMQSKDLNKRRIAANDLRQLAEQHSLSALAVRRLANLLERESDGLVWRSSLLAILPDDNPDTAALIASSANRPDPGIRALAAEFAFRHRRPEFADWLLPMLHDHDASVQIAAIEATARCANRVVIDGITGKNADESLPGLRSLLADHNPRVAVAAAIAMSRLGDPQGHDELIRLSRHADLRTREQVISAMGTTGQSRFVDTLIRIGWTAQDIRLRRAVLGSLENLVPAESRPDQLADARTPEEQIRHWAEWGSRPAKSP